MTETTDTYEVPAEIADPPEANDADFEPSPPRPWWKRVLKGLGITVVVVLLFGVLLYNFGGMMPPSADAKAQYAQLEAVGAVPPAQQKLHIPIPGCVCHSDNPVLQVQHANRSMNQCAGCHTGQGVAAQQ